MAEHVCKCKECHPELFPEVPVDTLGYVHALRHSIDMHPTWIKVDGVELRHVLEAFAGKDGWAVYYPGRAPGHIHSCSCGQRACADTKYGHVEFGPTRGTKSKGG